MELLAERNKTHGPFKDVAETTMAIRAQFHNTTNWKNLTARQAMCLEEIAHKISRILAGDPNFEDHWKDISGYAILATQP